MKLEALVALFSLLAAANARDAVFGRHAHIANAHKRQDPATSHTESLSTGTSTGSASLPAPTTSGAPPVGAPPASAPTPGASSATTSGSAPANSPTITTIPNIPMTGANGVPPLSQITSGMPTGTTYAASKTFSVGTTPTAFDGAPPLPSSFVFIAADWPPQDKIPPTDSPEVQEWMKELDGVDIPDFAPTVDGSCGGDPAAAAQAQQRGWWTCGGWTGPEDITLCPDKMTWGISFDDGPGPYTQKLLDYLDQKDLEATFFVVGSRCLERPLLLTEEYMAGHEISVHTWSHHPLTTLTNEQIVAELGWTRKIIKEVIGVTPTTMRAPFGDIDNRVRAISLAMGLRPIQWTRFNGFAFDTNDWKVPAGTVTPTDSMLTFSSILGNATIMDSGFVVLEHDLYEQTVDLAVGYTLEAAQTHNPPFTLKRIGECMSIPMTDMYLETTTNTTFPAERDKNVSGPKGAASQNNNNSAAARGFAVPAVGAIVAAGLALVGGSLLL